MIIRETENEFKKLIEDPLNKNVIILEGARQVGKTSLIQAALKKTPAIKINFETEATLNYKINQTQSYKEFIEVLKNEKNYDPQKRQIVFIDEAQENERLGAYVREMKESSSSTRWILTGSSMTRLFREEQRVPVGRISRYKLNPFTFVDFLTVARKPSLIEAIKTFPNTLAISDYMHGELLKLCDEYLKVGGLPEVVTAYCNHSNYRDVTQQLLLSQEDDFVRKVMLEKRHLFKDALKGVANNLGSSSNYTHISPRVHDAKEIVGTLERWHLINTVEQKGINTTTKFHPKRYLYDLGIAQLLRSHPFPSISIFNTLEKSLRTSLGGLFENLVYLSLQGTTIGNLNFSSWKKNNKEPVEVDFIWHLSRAIPIECKASLRLPNAPSSLKAYLNLAGVNVGFVISAAPYQVFKGDGKTIINLPIYLARPDIIEQLVNE